MSKGDVLAAITLRFNRYRKKSLISAVFLHYFGRDILSKEKVIILSRIKESKNANLYRKYIIKQYLKLTRNHSLDKMNRELFDSDIKLNS